MLWSNRDQTLGIMTDIPHAYSDDRMRFAMIGRMLSRRILSSNYTTFASKFLPPAAILDSSCLRLLTEEHSKQVQQLTYGRVYHVAMYMWAHTRNLHYSDIAWDIVSIGIGEQGPVVGSGPEHNVVVRQFLEEAVMQADRQNEVAARMSQILSNRCVFDRLLATYLSVFHMMITALPAILRSLSPTTLLQLRKSCSIAFQRQMCSGCTDDGMARTYEVLKTSMYVIS